MGIGGGERVKLVYGYVMFIYIRKKRVLLFFVDLKSGFERREARGRVRGESERREREGRLRGEQENKKIVTRKSTYYNKT